MTTALSTLAAHRPTRWEQAHNETARVDAERALVREQINAVFLTLPTNPDWQRLSRQVLPYCDLLTGKERVQSVCAAMPDLLNSTRVFGSLMELLTADAARVGEARERVLAALAKTYADDYATDVGNARAGSWA